jgi:hypothetical protein
VAAPARRGGPPRGEGLRGAGRLRRTAGSDLRLELHGAGAAGRFLHRVVGVADVHLAAAGRCRLVLREQFVQPTDGARPDVAELLGTQMLVGLELAHRSGRLRSVRAVGAGRAEVGAEVDQCLLHPDHGVAAVALPEPRLVVEASFEDGHAGEPGRGQVVPVADRTLHHRGAQQRGHRRVPGAPLQRGDRGRSRSAARHCFSRHRRGRRRRRPLRAVRPERTVHGCLLPARASGCTTVGRCASFIKFVAAGRALSNQQSPSTRR